MVDENMLNEETQKTNLEESSEVELEHVSKPILNLQFLYIILPLSALNSHFYEALLRRKPPSYCQKHYQNNNNYITLSFSMELKLIISIL